jgi:ribosomal protein S18 acetylase RimI-like enzyme
MAFKIERHIMKRFLFFALFMASVAFTPCSSMKVDDEKNDLSMELKGSAITKENFDQLAPVFKACCALNTAAFAEVESQNPIYKFLRGKTKQTIEELLEKGWENITLKKIRTNLESEHPKPCYLIYQTLNSALIAFALVYIESSECYREELKQDKDIQKIDFSFKPEGYQAGQEVYIDTLAVDPTFQGMEIGTGLIMAIKASIQSAQHFYLEVGVRNEKAQNFYAKMGFKQQALIKARTEANYIYSLFLP